MELLTEIDDFYEFITKEDYKKTKGYMNLLNIMPQYHKKCSKCDAYVFCWYCLEDVHKCIKNGNFEERCKFMKRKLEYIWQMKN